MLTKEHKEIMKEKFSKRGIERSRTDVVAHTCRTCAHKLGSKCMLSGRYATTERLYPSVCGRNFEGWQKKQGLIKRIKFWFCGA